MRNSYWVNRKSGLLFSEIDNRGNKLFVTLNYPDKIGVCNLLEAGSEALKLLSNVGFVLIKNWIYQVISFAFLHQKLLGLHLQIITYYKSVISTRYFFGYSKMLVWM